MPRDCVELLDLDDGALSVVAAETRSGPALAALACTCRRMRSLVEDGIASVWRDLVAANFPACAGDAGAGPRSVYAARAAALATTRRMQRIASRMLAAGEGARAASRVKGHQSGLKRLLAERARAAARADAARAGGAIYEGARVAVGLDYWHRAEAVPREIAVEAADAQVADLDLAITTTRAQLAAEMERLRAVQAAAAAAPGLWDGGAGSERREAAERAAAASDSDERPARA